MLFSETSSKSAENVAIAFYQLVSEIAKSRMENEQVKSCVFPTDRPVAK